MYNLNDINNLRHLLPALDPNIMLIKTLLGQQGIILLNFIQNNNITYSGNPKNSLNEQNIINKSSLDSLNAHLLCNHQNPYNPYVHSDSKSSCVEKDEFSDLIRNGPTKEFSYSSLNRNNINENSFHNPKTTKAMSLDSQLPNKHYENISNKSFAGVSVNANGNLNNKNCKNSYGIDNINESLIKNKLNLENVEVKEKEDLPKKRKIREKKYECKFENCKKSFEYKWILNRHLNSHFCFRLFKCEACSKSYKSKENLNLHIKNKHLGLKPYNCDFCDSKFSHRNGKTYHERKIHLKILPFACTFEKCESSFASKSALNYHLKYQH